MLEHQRSVLEIQAASDKIHGVERNHTPIQFKESIAERKKLGPVRTGFTVFKTYFAAGALLLPH